MTGRTKPMASVVFGRVRGALIDCCELQSQLQWKGEGFEMKIPGMEGSGSDGAQQDSGLGKEVDMRAASLRSKSKPAAAPETLDQAWLLVAHVAIWDAQGKIYGGFLRDWLINGEPAKDVDMLVSDGTILANKAIIKSKLESYRFVCTNDNPLRGGKPSEDCGHNLKFRFTDKAGQSHQMEVDILALKCVPKVAPGVDCDVGNFAFDKDGLRFKVHKKGFVSMEKSVKHCKAKQFVFYRKLPDGPGDCEEARLHKYILQKGWTCLSPIPNEVISRLRLPASNVKPESEFAQSYWTFTEVLS